MTPPRFGSRLPPEPAPPRSLYAVNTTHSSVTLLWSVEGVVDYYQVLCRPARPNTEAKVSLLDATRGGDCGGVGLFEVG